MNIIVGIALVIVLVVLLYLAWQFIDNGDSLDTQYVITIKSKKENI